MKIRIFKRLIDGVFHVRVQTEDWSENDRLLMIKHGEPEINLGGVFYAVSGSSSASSSSETVSTTLDTVYARVLTESPFTQKFDARDLSGVASAKSIADQWASTIESRIAAKVSALRSMQDTFTTEEVTEY